MRNLSNLFRRLLRKGNARTYQPVILVTGCSSGVGLALSELLYKMPEYRVVITARSVQKLRERFTESDRFMLRELDVTSKQSRQNLIREINERWQGVNILVNNAGILYRAVFEHMSDETELHQMTTNYLGPVELIRLALPGMRERGRGKIINISSVSGMLAMPTMSSYSASKYALEGMSEALWYELRPFGINVSLIQPGAIKSLSFKNEYRTGPAKSAEANHGVYSDYYENMEPFVERLMRWSLTSAEDVARKVIKVIHTENPPLWIPVTLDAFVFYYLRRFIPRRLLLPLLFRALPNSRKWGKAFTRKRAD